MTVGAGCPTGPCCASEVVTVESEEAVVDDVVVDSVVVDAELELDREDARLVNVCLLRYQVTDIQNELSSIHDLSCG